MELPSRGSATVYLVGAGPGAADLVTLRGLRALWAADVVAHDRLVAPELLAEAPDDAVIVDVGKTPYGRAWAQHDINALLIAHARSGATVVRLKGGDPFVFGRGGEEVAALAAAGVTCEVVPGVTAATAAAGAAGVPVTHRGIAASFAVVTPRSVVEPDWTALARIDTLVLMMSVKLLDDAVGALIAAGRSPSDAVMVVQSATLPEQRSWRTTLEELPAAIAGRTAGRPVTFVIGPVARLDLGAGDGLPATAGQPAENG